MKLAVRIVGLSLVLAGAVAASLSSSTTHAFASSQAVSSGLPVPTCGPNVPNCPTQPSPTK